MKSKTIKFLNFMIIMLLIYGVYSETGIYTALFALLMYTYCVVNNRFIEKSTWIFKILERMVNNEIKNRN